MGDKQQIEEARKYRGEIFSAHKLPVPRLELRWGRYDGGKCACAYNLVLMLGPYDIRHKKKDEYTGKSKPIAMCLGSSTSHCSGRDPSLPYAGDKELPTPFRDGAHVRWDAAQLGLRAFVVTHGKAQELFHQPASEVSDG